MPTINIISHRTLNVKENFGYKLSLIKKQTVINYLTNR